MEPTKRHQTLTTLLNKADHDYWVRNDPTLSDSDYDRSLQELKDIEVAHPELKTLASPTQRLGGGLLPGFDTKKHVAPMLSLDNIFDMKELETRLNDWKNQLGTVAFVVEPKIDGLSMDLKYDRGVLTQALTRGNGNEGDDVTENVRTIKSIPLFIQELKLTTGFHIRGEVFMSFKDFEKVNARQRDRGLPEFKNPRNAATGAIKSLDPVEVAARRLSFLPYHVIPPEGCVMTPEYQFALHTWFSEKGFNTLPWMCCSGDINDILDAVAKFEALRPTLPCPVDGAVIKINNRGFWSRFSDGSKSVRWGYAYKYAPEQAETILKCITIQVGRSGMLAPVAELEPVELAGSTISRATLCNAARISELDARVNDTVVIQKAGEIIPEVIRVIPCTNGPRNIPFEFPVTCPSCGSKVVRKKLAGDEESVALYCSKPLKCVEAIQKAIIHWCAKDAMDIPEVGPGAAELLVCNLDVTDVSGLYELTPDEMVEGGFGPKEAQKLHDAIGASCQAGMEAVIAGLGVDRIGKTLARRLARAYPDLNAFLDDIEGNWKKYLGTADINALKNDAQLGALIIDKLECVGVSMKSKTYSPEAAAGALAGKTIVFTGTLTMDRNKASRLAEDAGAKVTGSVSRKTDYVVVGTDAGSKATKAAELGVKILDEEAFLKLLDQD